jgi:hypothetical protein
MGLMCGTPRQGHATAGGEVPDCGSPLWMVSVTGESIAVAAPAAGALACTRHAPLTLACQANRMFSRVNPRRARSSTAADRDVPISSGIVMARESPLRPC